MSNIVAQIPEPMRQCLLALTVMMGWSSLACAQTGSVCDGLKKITAATPTQYVALRGTFDSAMDAYLGTVPVGALADCRTHSEKRSGEYLCEQRLADDGEQAKRAFEALVASVKTCFGANVKSSKSSMPDHRASFRHLVGGEWISVSYRRHVPKYQSMPPRYMLVLRISYRELNETP